MPGKGFIRDSVHKKKMLLENSFFVGALIFWYKSFFMIKMTKVWKFLPSRFSPGMISVSLKYEDENFEKCESFPLKMFTRDDFCIFKVWRWKFEKVWNFSFEDVHQGGFPHLQRMKMKNWKSVKVFFSRCLPREWLHFQIITCTPHLGLCTGGLRW